jgi:hypothetical protein
MPELSCVNGNILQAESGMIAGVAQPAEATGLNPVKCEFKSRRQHHKLLTTWRLDSRVSFIGAG